MTREKRTAVDRKGQKEQMDSRVKERRAGSVIIE